MFLPSNKFVACKQMYTKLVNRDVNLTLHVATTAASTSLEATSHIYSRKACQEEVMSPLSCSPSSHVTLVYD